MRRRGVTLIELLVVIAVIALLLGVLLPALAAGKDRGQNLICQSNLKQNAMATLLFVQNNDVYPFGYFSNGGLGFPPPGGFIGSASADWQGWWWFHQTADSTAPIDDALLRCPSQRETNNLLCGNYGANYSVYKIGNTITETPFRGPALKAMRVKHPGRTLLLSDSGYTLISLKATLAATEVSFENAVRTPSFFLPGLSANGHRPIAASQQTDAVKGRHYGRTVNAAFADGGVRSLKASHLTVSDPNESGPGRTYIWLP
jgi:prepilin-type N-terminal cleavage/methylation domain-containing protein/prepilin-type processing-associated H-X9-DG protein